MQSNASIKLIFILLICSIVSSVQAASIQEARSLYQAGKYKAAMEQTNALLKGSPGDIPALFLKAQINSENQRVDTAINTYKQLLALSPGHLQAYNNLAALYAQQGKLELASETLEAAIRTDPIFTTIHTNLRAIYMDMSQKHYRRALKLKTEDSPTQIASIDLDDGIDQILNQEINVVPQSVQEAVNTSVITGSARSNRKPEQKTNALAPEKTTTLAVTKSPTNIAKPVSPKADVAVAVAPKKAETKVAPATTKPEPKATPNLAREVKQALLSWANAWSNRDAQKYVSAYLGNYATSGKTHKDWAAGRRWNFKNKKYIKVALSDIRIQADGDQYRASFKQQYESDSYKDVVNKELLFVRHAGRWKIAKEVTS